VKGTFAPVLKHQVIGTHVRDLEVQVQHITHLDTALHSYYNSHSVRAHGTHWRGPKVE